MQTRVNHDKDRRVFKMAAVICFVLGAVAALMIPAGVHVSIQTVVIPLVLGLLCLVFSRLAA